jgi:ABC-type antimicrobial peptide transport system permease subunit
VKVYGTFSFQGLEKSELAGSTNLTDIQTFRDLYGLMSSERRAELDAIKSTVGVSDVKREDVEAELFGGGDVGVVTEREAGTFDELSGVDLKNERQRIEELMAQSFDQKSIDRGVALNAAVILKDPKKLGQTMREIEAALKTAQLDVQVTDWMTASGIVGQFIYVLRGVLTVAIFVIFLVTIVIINNSMVMATMDRVPEIGTMRAIGASRGTVMRMVLTETIALGLIAGGLGALAGVGMVAWLGAVGIPAGTTDILIFLFAGPRLHPTFTAMNVVVGIVVILVVSLISTLYPARLAANIQPVVAMQGKD